MSACTTFCFIKLTLQLQQNQNIRIQTMCRHQHLIRNIPRLPVYSSTIRLHYNLHQIKTRQLFAQLSQRDASPSHYFVKLRKTKIEKKNELACRFFIHRSFASHCHHICYQKASSSHLLQHRQSSYYTFYY